MRYTSFCSFSSSAASHTTVNLGIITPPPSPPPPPPPPHISHLLSKVTPLRLDSGFSHTTASTTTTTAFTDSHQDSINDHSETRDPNERNARIAVRYALRNSIFLDAFSVHGIIGFGSNGVVLSASVASGERREKDDRHHHPSHSRGQPTHAIKIIYRINCSSSSSKNKRDLPAEIRVLDLISSQNPHPNILTHVSHWEDARHFYLITELHGHSAFSLSSVSSPPLTFWNDRQKKSCSLPISSGSSDLWSWNLAMSRREYDPSTATPSFSTPSVTYPLNPAPMSSCRTLFSNLAKAVHHLHGMGITHGDLKEENVLVDPLDLSVKLCDFGHATTASRQYRLTAYGTREMTPPEILPNLHPSSSVLLTADPFQADVFALGMVLYSLLHGPGCLPAEVGKSARRGEPLGVAFEGCAWYPVGVVRRDVGEECLDLLMRMTAVDVGVRLDMEGVLAHPWVRGH
ncbi:hypothetical protein HDU67_003076 [Dinochytrium kinnereticum]|nr:hypothetical protein HDU67_003076 [Dinochytrium kinnereticum]